jgi:hypothetical protein
MPRRIESTNRTETSNQSEEAKMRVFKILPATHALSNISLRRVKISRFADLNDPFELLAANLTDPAHRAAFARLKRELSQSRGLLCFSRNWSNPLLWGHYAERHSGIALGFEVPDELLAKVIYTSRRVKLRVDQATKAVQIHEKTVNRLLRTKFIDWKYEDEMRVFVSLDPNMEEAGMYFQDFSPALSLASVVLGPRCELPIDKVRLMLEPDLSQVKVVKARMGFKEFRVVEDRAYRS